MSRDWLTEYAGLPWREAVARAEADGRTVRVLRPGTPATKDFRPDRLNVLLDEHDDLVELTAG